MERVIPRTADQRVMAIAPLETVRAIRAGHAVRAVRAIENRHTGDLAGEDVVTGAGSLDGVVSIAGCGDHAGKAGQQVGREDQAPGAYLQLLNITDARTGDIGRDGAQRVIAGAAAEHIAAAIAIPRPEQVIARAAIQRVKPGAAVQVVVAIAAQQAVVPGLAMERVIPRTADQRVEAGIRAQEVIALAAHDAVIAALAIEGIIPRAAEQRVIAVTALQIVSAIGAGDAVGAVRAIEGRHAGDLAGQGIGAGRGGLDGVGPVTFPRDDPRHTRELRAGERDVVGDLELLDSGDGGRAQIGGHGAQRVVARAALDHIADHLGVEDVNEIIARAAIHGVAPIPAAQIVIPIAAEQAVIAGLAVKRVIPRAADQRVLAVPAPGGVIAAAAIEPVQPIAAIEDVLAVAALDRVIAVIAREAVIAAEAAQRVIAVIAEEGVIAGVEARRAAGAAGDQIIQAGAGQAVGGVGPIDVRHAALPFRRRRAKLRRDINMSKETVSIGQGLKNLLKKLLKMTCD